MERGRPDRSDRRLFTPSGKKGIKFEPRNLSQGKVAGGTTRGGVPRCLLKKLKTGEKGVSPEKEGFGEKEQRGGKNQTKDNHVEGGGKKIVGKVLAMLASCWEKVTDACGS